MITKTPTEIAVMKEGGVMLGGILQKLLLFAQPGVTLQSIDIFADELIQQTGGTASFRTVAGYKWSTCLCVNNVVVHGIPTEYVIKDGDVLTIDVGLLYQGFHTDTAWTKEVKSPASLAGRQKSKVKSDDKEQFLRIGEETLWGAIEQARIGNRIGHISQAIQHAVEGAGFSVVKTLVGHGVGRQLHEAPQVPGILKGTVESTPLLEEGMTLAIEVIYAQNRGAVEYTNSDGWSIGTKDKSLSAVFEHSVAVTSGGRIILTQAEK